MTELNRIVSYWYDCIKNEDVLEKNISLNVKTKAVLYPFDQDSFIFDRKDKPLPVSQNEKLVSFSEYISAKGYDAYYGYPILFYFDSPKKALIAPLFIIKVKFIKKEDKLYLEKDEQSPTCGIQAFSKLGFHIEEIAAISQSLEALFLGDLSDSKLLAEKSMKLIEKEANIQIKELINPISLTNSERLKKDMVPGLYNKSLIFAGENTAYNISLLQDLLALKKKDDLDKTSLSFILDKISRFKGPERIPILPFPSNEYQMTALQDIFNNKFSVITGPPGTGKSQYISNLLINLFLEGKTVLFVSHTNPAVDVVNEKINRQFRNLILRTGNKGFRQELGGKFNELLLDSEKTFKYKTKLKD
jgi:hypothetical protein